MIQKIITIIFIAIIYTYCQPTFIHQPTFHQPIMHHNNFYENLFHKVMLEVLKSILESLDEMDLSIKIDSSIKGPVKELVITETRTELKRGKQIEKTLFFKQKKFNTDKYLTELITADNDGDKDEILKYMYNSKNKLIKKMVYDESLKDLEDVIIYIYNKNDTLTNVKVYDEYGNLERDYVHKYFINRVEIIDNEDVEKIYYNQLDQKVKYENWDDGKLDDYKTFFYNLDNQVIKIKKAEMDEDTVQWETTTLIEYQNEKIKSELVSDKSDEKILNIKYFYTDERLTYKEYHDLKNNKVKKVSFFNFDKYGNFTRVKIEENGSCKTRNYSYFYYE